MRTATSPRRFVEKQHVSNTISEFTRCGKVSCHTRYWELENLSHCIGPTILTLKKYFHLSIMKYYCNVEVSAHRSKVWLLCYHKFTLPALATRLAVRISYKHDIWPPAATVQSTARLKHKTALISSRVLEFRGQLIYLPNGRLYFKFFCIATLYVLTAGVMIQMFWNITPCLLVNVYRRVNKAEEMSPCLLNSDGIWSNFFGL